MGYIDILIPLIAGILLLLFPDIFIKETDASYQSKKANLKKVALLAIGVAIIYFFIKIAN